MFNKILVALDGSAHADRALEMAIDIARKYDASLLLFHAIQVNLQVRNSTFSGRVADAAKEAYRKIGREIAEEIIAKATARARDEGLERVTSLFVEGEPATSIIDTAAREQADLLVLGTRGMSGLRQIIVGSVAHKVTIAAHAPVLVTK